MHHRRLATLAAGTVLLLAGCTSGSATSAPATAAPATAAPAVPSAEASAAPSVEASAPAAETACAKSAAAGEVAVSIEGFVFSPANIQAKVGQTVTFTNGDSASHTATLDDRSCTTANLAKGASDGLTFSAAGTYPFHCKVHPDMKGTITVS